MPKKVARPNEGHVHEVLHTLFLLSNNLEDYVLGNDLFRAKGATKGARKKVKKALALLQRAYQEVGAIGPRDLR